MALVQVFTFSVLSYCSFDFLFATANPSPDINNASPTRPVEFASLPVSGSLAGSCLMTAGAAAGLVAVIIGTGTGAVGFGCGIGLGCG